MAQKPKTVETPADDDGGEETPQFITGDQLNAAITGRLNDFQKKLNKSLGDTIAQSIAAAMGGQAKPAENQDGEQAKPGGGQTGPDAKTAKELADTKAALARIQEERAKEAEQARKGKRMSLLDAALEGVKVHPKLKTAAIRLLEDSITDDDDGSGRIVFKRVNSYGVEERVAVDEAIRGWAKSDEGRAFIAAPATRGSGQTTSRPDRPAPRNESERKAHEAQDKTASATATVAAFLTGRDPE